MNIEYVCKKDRLYSGGNEILSYKLETPVFFGADEITSFYTAVSDECEKYCKGELFDRLCVRGDRKRYSYVLICRVTYCGDGVASVILFACLRSGKELLSKYARAHTWELASGLLLPPEYVWRREKGNKKAKREDVEGVFIDGGRVRNIREVDIWDLLAR